VCVGGGRAASDFRELNGPKKTGDRSARARWAAKTPFILALV